jgi:hypothetical protein
MKGSLFFVLFGSGFAGLGYPVRWGRPTKFTG